MTFYYWDGSGSYVFPVHLAGHGSKMIDMKVLATSGQLDAHGHAFKLTETEGSAIIRNAAGERAGVTLVVAGGTYNPVTATCGTTCVTCCGYNDFVLSPSAFYCPLDWSMSFAALGTDCNGDKVQLAVSAWRSSNTSVATIDNSGLMNAIAVGSVNISATLDPVVATSGTVCFSGGTAYCPTETPQVGGSGAVVPTVSVSCTPTDLALGPTAPSNTTKGTCTTTVSPGGGTYSWSVDKNTVKLSGTAGSSINFPSASASSAVGDTTISVQYTVNGQSSTSKSAGIYIQTPASLSLSSTTYSGQPEGNYACPSGESGWEREVTWQVLDQLGHPMRFALLPVQDQLSVGGTNSCGLSLSAGTGSTNADGTFGDVYSFCSTACSNGSCQTNASQTYTVAGVQLTGTISISYECNSISLNGE